MATTTTQTMLERSFLEQEVPALISESDLLYDAVAPRFADLVQVAVDEVLMVEMSRPMVGEADHTTVDVVSDINVQRWAVRRAVADVVPQLDLVATANGFGVVSNQNISPASRERVMALRRNLYEMAEMYKDRFYCTTLYGLNRVPRTYVTCATVARALGLMNPQEPTEPLTNDTFALIITDVLYGEGRLREVISPELYDSLLEEGVVGAAVNIRCGFGLNNVDLVIDRLFVTPSSVEFADKCLTYVGLMARVHRSNDREALRRVALLKRELKRTMNEALEESWMAAYVDSSTYEADRATCYENEAGDPTFFFG